jgi:signal transduction histidine kinase
VKPEKSFGVQLLRAALMIGITASISLALWSTLQVRERVRIRELAAMLARSMQIDLSDEMSSRLLAHVRLAKLTEDGLPRKNWEDQAKVLMIDHPGFLAEQWVDSAFRVRDNVEAAEVHPKMPIATDLPLKGFLETVVSRRGKDAMFSPAFRLGNGKACRSVVVPLYSGDNFRGFLIGVFDEEENFDSILKDQVNKLYSTVVFEGQDEIYRMPGSSTENEKQWGQDLELQLPGAIWRIRVWPKPGMFREIRSTLLETALAMGAVVGLLLFLTVDFARNIYGHAKDLGRARDQLEKEVQERTADLQSANKDLQGEICERKLAEESLRELSGHLLRLRDEEQRRIARELHDSTSQILGALAINLDRVRQLVPNGGSSKLQDLLAQSADLAERARTEIRTLSYLLHPQHLDDLGLEGAVPWYAAGFSSRCGIPVRVEIQTNLGRFPREVELALFRIVQEALTNIHLHSGSKTAEIILFGDANRVTLRVRDHGHGIPRCTFQQGGDSRVTAGVGIAGMRERMRQLGGCLEIESSDSGTQITAMLPTGGAVSANEDDNRREAETVRQQS